MNISDKSKENNNSFNPLYDTTTTADLTQKTIKSAKDNWEIFKFKPKEHFYRINLEETWTPSRETPDRRWGGLQKPKTKNDALNLYALDSNYYDIQKPWYLFTFVIENIDTHTIFHSKVKGGTGTQIKINNPACKDIRIISKELLLA